MPPCCGERLGSATRLRTPPDPPARVTPLPVSPPCRSSFIARTQGVARRSPAPPCPRGETPPQALRDPLLLPAAGATGPPLCPACGTRPVLGWAPFRRAKATPRQARSQDGDLARCWTWPCLWHSRARHGTGGTGGTWISPGGCGACAASLLGPQTPSFPPHPRATPSGARLLPAGAVRAQQAPRWPRGRGGPTASPAKLALAHTSQAESAPHLIPCPPRHLLPFRAPRFLRPLPTGFPETLGDPPKSVPPSLGEGRGVQDERPQLQGGRILVSRG